MEAFLKRHFLVSLVGAFFLGAISLWSAKVLFDYYQAKPLPKALLGFNHEPPKFDDFFSHEFFTQSRDPFKEMDRMQNEIMKNFGPFKQNEDAFGSWFKQSFGGGAPSDFKMTEDEQFVYYEIDAGVAVPEKFDVEVRDGQVIVKGELKKKEDSSEASSFHSSNFVRSFPVPENVDANSFKLEQKGSKIAIKFPKSR